ncbi:MAG TPA: NnrS family protein [Casimicrobiaceae bacterium]
MRGAARARFAGALWASGFRPFFLLGALYGLLALGAGLGGYVGLGALSPAAGRAALWHGHEMVFGFAAAIISGLLLTALPSWAGVHEIRGGELAALVLAWLAGRVAMWVAPSLSPLLAAAADLALLLLVTAALAPDLLAVRQRKFAVVLPVLLALAGADVAFHAAQLGADAVQATRALDAAVAVIAVLFALVGGFMTPVFTRSALPASAAFAVRRRRGVERAAHLTIVAFAVTVALPTPAALAGATALAACLAHALRLAGWRGWSVRKSALVLSMHVAYAWLVVALALRAGAELGAPIAPRAWVHAATVGAFGTMMLSLMPRVALRHTGRALALHPAMRAALVAVSAAAVLRLGASTLGWGAWAIVAALGLWSFCFVAYLVLYAPLLLRPSLPRA